MKLRETQIYKLKIGQRYKLCANKDSATYEILVIDKKPDNCGLIKITVKEENRGSFDVWFSEYDCVYTLKERVNASL